MEAYLHTDHQQIFELSKEELNVYDVVKTSDIIFENQFLEKCDLNNDGSLTEDDINVLLNFIFN